MTDPIANMLTQIRNAYMARKEAVVVPYSRLKHELANKLAQAGYLGEVTVSGETAKKTINIALRYHKSKPILTHLKRISRPSVRVFATANKIPSALSGKGVTVLTTSKGIMTNKEAHKAGIGGEVICQIW